MPGQKSKAMNAKKITFKNYVEKKGYTVLKSWNDGTGYCAMIDGFNARRGSGIRDFTQVYPGGKVVRLSLKDVANPAIVGLGVLVVFE